MKDRIIAWLLSKLSKDEIRVLVAPSLTLEILPTVEEKMRAVEGLPGVSSEGKRSMVYGALVKRFPNVPRRHIALAIEIIIQKR